VDLLDAADRGLSYGDGVFETMLAHAGQLPWWPRHRARWAQGAQRLGIAFPEDSVLEQALSEALQQQPSGVIKLMLTRGVGGRGYTPTPSLPTLIVSISERPAAPQRSLSVDMLRVTLAEQPMLAGIKHLNRLEQVLGSMEVHERGLDDGLMATNGGDIACGTRANVFACIAGQWRTPPVDRAGVAGTARSLLLEQWPELDEAPLHSRDLDQVEALFLANAVRGILAVGRLGARSVDSGHSGIATARALLAASHPGFREI
jgi:4-amino-4-deoxychorismate lyase